MAPSDPALTDISALQPHEIAAANALVREAGWNQTAADWRLFLSLGRVYAIRDSNGHLVATAATLPHEKKFAWISMVLVNAAFRRQGLATRLLHRCIDDLTRAGCVPVLDATPAGREVYRLLGFQDSWSYHRLASRTPSRISSDVPSSLDVYPLDDSIWPAVCDYDASAFGARRDGLLAGLRGRLPAAEYCALRDGNIVGFLLGREGRSASQIGPLIADDDEVARALLHRALALIRVPVYIDLADSKTAVCDALMAAGFSAQRPLTRMLLGTSERFDDARRTFAVVGPEFG